MAVASTPTKLSLDEFAAILGLHPLHFAGIEYVPPNRMASATCDSIVPQYDWQHVDRVSREQIARAIEQAEGMLEEYLGYRLAPWWEAAERHKTVSYFAPELRNLPWNVRGLPPSVSARWGLFIRPGVRACTPLTAGAVVWSDENGDELPDTGTVAVSGLPSGTEECEVRLFHPGTGGDSAYEIRPLTSVVITDTTATVTFARHLLVKRSLYEGYEVTPAHITDDDDFEATVDAYRVYNDPSTQATLLFEPGSCCCGSCDGCNLGTADGCLYLRSEPRLSRLAYSGGTYDAETGLWTGCETALCATPDLIDLNYQAGLQCNHPSCTSAPGGVCQTVCRRWAHIIAGLAMSLIDRPTCDCSAQVWEYWRDDLGVSSTSGSHSQSRTPLDVLQNPFGTKRGAVYAWQRVTDRNVAITGVAQLVG